MKDRKSLHTARHRRERMRKAGPVREVGPRVWLHKPAHLEKWATMEREAFRQYQQARGPLLEALARDCRRDWRRQYAQQETDAAAVEKLAGGDVRDRLRLARIAGRRRLATDSPGTGTVARRGGFGRKLRGAWKEARALGVRAAVGAVRSDPAELKRLAMAKLERGHWRGARSGSGSTTPTRAVAAETRGGSCVRPGGGRGRRTGPPSVCRPWSGRSAKPPGRHRLNGCPIEARAATVEAASSAEFFPDLYPSGARDRPLEAILRPIAFPKHPERGRWARSGRPGGPVPLDGVPGSPWALSGPFSPSWRPCRPLLRAFCVSPPPVGPRPRTWGCRSRPPRPSGRSWASYPLPVPAIPERALGVAA